MVPDGAGTAPGARPQRAATAEAGNVAAPAAPAGAPDAFGSARVARRSCDGQPRADAAADARGDSWAGAAPEARLSGSLRAAAAPPGALLALAPRVAGKGSRLGATVSFLNNILSGGALGLPFCFRRCGLGLGGLLLLSVQASQTFTLRQLLYAATVTRRASYEEVAEAALGRAARHACVACTLCLQFGCLVAYLGVLADLVSATVSPIIPPGADVGRVDYMVAICGGVLLPLCLMVRSEEALSRTSIFSIVFLCGFSAATLCLAAVPVPGVVHEPLRWWQPGGVALALPVLVFAMAGHSAFIPCIATMREPTLRRADGVLTRAMRGAGAVYAAVGVAGYAAFRERTAGNLLRNFTMVAAQKGRRAAAVRHLKLGFAFSVAGAVPVTVLPVREAVLGALAEDDADADADAASPLMHACINAVVLCVTLLLAALLPNVELVFALTGATACVMIAYVFPAAIFLSVQRQQQQQREQREQAAYEAGKGDDTAASAAAWAGKGDDAAASAAAWAGTGDDAAADAGACEAELFGMLAGAPARVLSRALLVLGVVGMVMCTTATLRAVSEEATVVSAAQALVVKSEAAVTAAQALAKAAQAACTLTGLAAAGAATAGSCQPPAGPADARLVMHRGAAPAAAPAHGVAAAEETLALAVEQAEEAGRVGGVAASVLRAASAAAQELEAGVEGEQPGANVTAAADEALASAGAVADAAVVAVRDAVATLDPLLAARAKELAAALGAAAHVSAALAVAAEREDDIAADEAAHAQPSAPGADAVASWDNALEDWDLADGEAAAARVFAHAAANASAGRPPPAPRPPSPPPGGAKTNGTKGLGDLLLSRLGAVNQTLTNRTA